MTLSTYDWGDKSSSGLVAMDIVKWGWLSGSDLLANNGENYKGCKSVGDFSGCAGQVMPVSTAASACDCDSEGCKILWTYQ